MKRPVAALLLVLAPLCAAPLAAKPAAAQLDASAAFKQLSTLAGTWRDADKPNSPLRVRFYLTAGGTVLVESWEARGKPHSLTLYHMAGKRLIATHYCPQGNQPRLALVPGSLRFKFLDATGLEAGESHLTELHFDLSNPLRPVRSEIYHAATEASPSNLALVRA
jgi:hypothetical protein